MSRAAFAAAVVLAVVGAWLGHRSATTAARTGAAANIAIGSDAVLVCASRCQTAAKLPAEAIVSDIYTSPSTKTGAVLVGTTDATTIYVVDLAGGHVWSHASKQIIERVPVVRWDGEHLTIETRGHTDFGWIETWSERAELLERRFELPRAQ